MTKIDQAISVLRTYEKDTITAIELQEIFPTWDKTAIRNMIVALRRRGLLKSLRSKHHGGPQVYKINLKRPSLVKKSAPDRISIKKLREAVDTIIAFVQEK